MLCSMRSTAPARADRMEMALAFLAPRYLRKRHIRARVGGNDYVEWEGEDAQDVPSVGRACGQRGNERGSDRCRARPRCAIAFGGRGPRAAIWCGGRRR